MDRLSATDQQQSIVWDATAFKWPLDLLHGAAQVRSCTHRAQGVFDHILPIGASWQVMWPPSHHICTNTCGLVHASFIVLLCVVDTAA